MKYGKYILKSKLPNKLKNLRDFDLFGNFIDVNNLPYYINTESNNFTLTELQQLNVKKLKEKETDNKLYTNSFESKTNNSIVKPKINESLVKPKTNKLVLKTKINESLFKPKINNLVLKTKTNNSLMKPKTNNSLMKPKTNNSLMKPKTNNSILKPKTNNSLMKPKTNNSLMKPKNNNLLIKKDELKFLPYTPSEISDTDKKLTEIKDNVMNIENSIKLFDKEGEIFDETKYIKILDLYITKLKKNHFDEKQILLKRMKELKKRCIEFKQLRQKTSLCSILLRKYKKNMKVFNKRRTSKLVDEMTSYLKKATSLNNR